MSYNSQYPYPTYHGTPYAGAGLPPMGPVTSRPDGMTAAPASEPPAWTYQVAGGGRSGATDPWSSRHASAYHRSDHASSRNLEPVPGPRQQASPRSDREPSDQTAPFGSETHAWPQTTRHLAAPCGAPNSGYPLSTQVVMRKQWNEPFDLGPSSVPQGSWGTFGDHSGSPVWPAEASTNGTVIPPINSFGEFKYSPVGSAYREPEEVHPIGNQNTSFQVPYNSVFTPFASESPALWHGAKSGERIRDGQTRLIGPIPQSMLHDTLGYQQSSSQPARSQQQIGTPNAARSEGHRRYNETMTDAPTTRPKKNKRSKAGKTCGSCRARGVSCRPNMSTATTEGGSADAQEWPCETCTSNGWDCFPDSLLTKQGYKDNKTGSTLLQLLSQEYDDSVKGLLASGLNPDWLTAVGPRKFPPSVPSCAVPNQTQQTIPSDHNEMHPPAAHRAPTGMTRRARNRPRGPRAKATNATASEGDEMASGPSGGQDAPRTSSSLRSLPKRSGDPRALQAAMRAAFNQDGWRNAPVPDATSGLGDAFHTGVTTLISGEDHRSGISAWNRDRQLAGHARSSTEQVAQIAGQADGRYWLRKPTHPPRYTEHSDEDPF